ncbi:hypothetical protein [Phaeobacter sp. 22II1-1F12B]|uniref:hypothetical protein n=1 Tax=Phaeobacter sp. 22II1-1F12B TaxID=1317111 RepID=UPI000B52861F|nr:hypothetical protein [Phaeobacter sp. 22II1-1F12B]OWU80418.1 hypothetical protein ATO1_08685 [Phaeobacter sp. 22II1-1F12B]
MALDFTVERSVLQCFPDSVRFQADLSGFDTQVPSSFLTTAHNPQIPNLQYFWDFGDGHQDGNIYTKMTKLPRNLRRASGGRGYFAAHMYREEDDYDVKLTVVDPATGHSESVVKTITVKSQDGEFPGTQTTVINPIGDNDFSGKPAGARERNLDVFDQQALVNLKQTYNVPQRFLFKRGCTFEFYCWWDQNAGWNSMIGSYGPSEEPVDAYVPYTGEANEYYALYVRQHYNGLFDAAVRDLRVEGIAFRGDYDPVTTRGYAAGGEEEALMPPVTRAGIYLNKHCNSMIHNCTFEGFGRSTIIADGFAGYEAHCHLNDIYITDAGGEYITFYGTFNYGQSSVVQTGVSILQNPDATDGEYPSSGGSDKGGSRSAVRCNTVRRHYFAHNEYFVTDGSNHCVKLANTSASNGNIVVFIDNCAEGGTAVLSLCQNIGTVASGQLGYSREINGWIEGNILVGAHSTQQLLFAKTSGWHFVNNTCYQPAGQNRRGGLKSFVFVETSTVEEGPSEDSLLVPFRIYSNTMRMDRTSAQNGGITPTIFLGVGGSLENLYTDWAESNNLLHMPNLNTASTAFGPVTDEVVVEPMTIGRRDPFNFGFDGSFATTGAVRKTVPTGVSPAIGGATSDEIAYLDAAPRFRVTPADVGAWQS